VNLLLSGERKARPGGLAFYAGATLASLGCPTTVVTRLAAEDEALLSSLRSAGATIRRGSSARTTVFENRYLGEPARGIEANARWQLERAPGGDDRAQRQLQQAEPILSSDLEGVSPSWWVFGPLCRTDVAPALLSGRAPVLRAAKADVFVALDPQGWLRHVAEDGSIATHPLATEAERALGTVDVLKVSGPEGRVLTGRDGPADIASALTDRGPREVLVSLGAEGAYVRAPGCSAHVPAPAVGVVDPTGAGDTLLAAYVWARGAGAAPQEAARLAVAAASLAASTDGPVRVAPAELRRWAGSSPVSR
jgi:hypothetical protein